MKQVEKTPNKSVFLQEWLKQNPHARDVDAASAWQATGQPGKISPSLFYKVKGEMGLNAARKKSAPPRAQRPGSPAKNGKSASPNGHATHAPERKHARSADIDPSDRASSLVGLEGEIDRLIFQIMAVGGLDEVESVLRHARRILVRSHNG